MPSSAPALRQLIGGRWAFSWASYLLLAPLATLYFFLTIPAVYPPANWLIGLAIALASYAAVGVVLWIAALTVGRNSAQQAMPIWLVAIVGALAWGARSLATGTGLALAGLPSYAGIVERLAFGAALGAFMVPFAAWIIGSVRTFQAERDGLIEQLVTSQVDSAQQAVFNELLRKELLEQVASRITERAQSVPWPTAATPIEQGTIGEIEGIAALGGRTLSRRLLEAERQTTRIGVGAVLRLGASTRPFAPWVAILVALFGFAILQRLFSPEQALLAAAVAGVWLLTMATAANRFSAKASGRSGAWITALALVLMGLAAIPVRWILGHPASGVADLAPIVVLAAVTAPAAMYLSGIPRSLSLVEERVIARLRESLTESEIRAAQLHREESRVRQDLAIELHGKWSANLTAAAMRLRFALDEGDEITARAALAEAQRLIELNLDEYELHQQSNLSALLESITNSWRGLVSINCEVDPDLALTPAQMSSVDDVVTEAINNAVRHADAKVITIRISAEVQGARITVRDDGQYASQSGPGLGSQIYEGVSRGEWSLTPISPRGMELQVLIVSQEPASQA